VWVITLKHNEDIGYKVEREIAQRYPAYTFSTKGSCWDFSTPEYLFEVKSTHYAVKNGKKFKARAGRFFIHRDSHESLAIRAKGELKKAHYIFAMLDEKDNILRYTVIPWGEVNDMLKKLKLIKRGDYEMPYWNIVEFVL